MMSFPLSVAGVRMLAALTLLASPSIAAAEVSAGAAAWMEPRFEDAMRLSPSWSATSPAGSFDVRGLLASGGERVAYRGLGLRGAGWLGRPGSFRGEVAARLAHAERIGGDVALGRATARVHLAGASAGVWAGLAVEGLSGGIERGVFPLLELGAWTRSHGVAIAWELEQSSALLSLPGAFPDTSRDTSRTADLRFSVGPTVENFAATFTTLRTHLHWQRARLELESTAGVSFSLVAPTRRWAHTTLSYRLIEPLTLFATVGNRSGEPVAVPRAEPRQASVGIKLSQWRPETRPHLVTALPHVESCKLARLESDQYLLEVRAPGAARVEAMGDMTGWLPFALDAVGTGRFRTLLTLSPGPHAISVRIDGGPWIAPPGAPRAPDSVDGSSGILLAR